MKKKKLLRILFVVMIILINILVFWKIDFSDLDTSGVQFVIRLSADRDDIFQIYYSKAGQDFNEGDSQAYYYEGSGTVTVVFDFLMDYDNLRFDFGDKAGTTIIYDMYFDAGETDSTETKYMIPSTQLAEEENAVGITDRSVFGTGASDTDDLDGEAIEIASEGGDPNMLIQFHKDQLLEQYRVGTARKTMILRIVLCALIDLIAIYVLIHFFSLIDIPVEIYQNRRLAMTLAKNDFKTKYAGSYLGMVWAFIQPIVTIAVYWFVFTVGLRAGRVGAYPFVLFLVVGIIPWFFFSDSLNGGTNAMTDYNYLVKKVVFNIDILPFVKVMSAFFVHMFFIVFGLILCTCMGYPPSIYTVQLIYYIFCNFVFVLGLSYLSSSIVVFFRDLGQFINIFVIQVGVWVTPIMWDAETVLKPAALKVFKLNPMYYIVSGFRDSVLAKQWFWSGDRLLWTIYFWMVTVLIFGLGAKVFRRLKVHFADVL